MGLSFSRRTEDSRTRRYRVVHETTYTYDAEVTSSFGRCYLSPRELSDQRVDEHAITVGPEPSDRSEGVDAYGNTDTYFHVTTPHTRLLVRGESVVEVDPLDRAITDEGPALAPWELARPVGEAGALAAQYRLDQRPAEIDDAVRAYADAIFTPGKPLVEAVEELTTRIYTDFAYKSGATNVSTRVGTVMERREGVCQDFAHIMTAICRSWGIPTRYVSGYLHPKPNAAIGETVAGESHAWVEWFCGGEWRGYDPTNLIEIGDRHVLVGRGRDYNDVPPLRGVYAGPFGSTLFVKVEITREA